MSQVAFAFDDTPLPALAAPRIPPASPAGAALAAASDPAAHASAVMDSDATGRRIGRDHAHHGLMPPLAHLHADSPVRAGWQAGRAIHGARTLPHGPALRHWLTLRLQAWQCGEAFEELQVTPLLLSRLAAAGHCPVTRQPVRWADPSDPADPAPPETPAAPGDAPAHATAAPTTTPPATTATTPTPSPRPAAITRLNPQAAWALGHLVLLDRQALRARQALGDAALIAQLLRDTACGGAGDTAWPAALPTEAWLRLGVLVSFATPLPHAQAARLPLRVLPGHGVRVINPVQALQLMLTLQFCAGGYARRLLDLAVLMPCTQTRQAFQIFMHTLLARRLQAGPRAEGRALRQALEDSWADPLVLRRWQRLALRLSAADCERLLQRATQRGLVVGGGHWISGEQATDGWGLPERSAALPRDTGAAPDGRLPPAAVPGDGSAERPLTVQHPLPAVTPAAMAALLPASLVQARLRRGSPWPHQALPPAEPALQVAPSGAAYFRAGRLRNRGSQKLAS